MNYFFIHKKIRNDEHCPICRKYYISFHDSLDNAYNKAMDLYQFDNYEQKLLKKGYGVWKDEWERRRNGDYYIILEIEKDFIYKFSKIFSINSVVNNNVKEKNKFHFMIIKIKLNKLKSCPDNIKFQIIFFQNNDDAIEFIYNRYNIKYFAPISIDIKNSGIYLNIINIEKNNELCLNDLYDKIQPENW